MNDCIKAVYITDEGYAMPTCVSISSLIFSMDESDVAKIYIICDMLSDLAKERFILLGNSKVRIELIEMQSGEYRKLARANIREEDTHVTGTALFKFRLAEILQQEDKVIYLDGDTLVQKSLRGLYDHGLEDYYVAAVNDMLDMDAAGHLILAKRIGLDREDYFNSGVMLLNLKKMRTDAVADKLVEYRKSGINYFMDQDALNAVLGRRRLKLPYIYNFMSTVTDAYDADMISEKFFAQPKDSIEELIDAAVVLHLTGTRKPWKYCMPWYSNLFLKYYEKSPYGTEKLYLKSLVKELRDELYEMRSVYESRINHLVRASRGKDYVVPYERIERGCRLVLYGAGNVGRSYYRQLASSKYCKVIMWVDKKGAEAGDDIMLPSEIVQAEYDYILIAIKKRSLASEARALLIKEYAVDADKIITIFEE